MTIEPSLHIVIMKVEGLSITHIETELVGCAQEVMMEDNNRSIVRLGIEVILHPTEDIRALKPRGMVTSQHGYNDIMSRTHVEGIPRGTVDALKELFTISTLHQVMVAQRIKYRAIHIRRIH